MAARKPPRRLRGYTEHWYRMVKLAIHEQPWCTTCGATTDLTGDHIIPLSKGGTNVPSNIMVLCRRCNSSKGANTTPKPTPKPQPRFSRRFLTGL
jgi:5-methylcytosine-specific restriction endonuclease McrA